MSNLLANIGVGSTHALYMLGDFEARTPFSRVSAIRYVVGKTFYFNLEGLLAVLTT